MVFVSAARRRPPPWALAATLPVARKRRERSRTKLSLTPKRAATACWLSSPDCHAVHTRTRKSSEYALGIGQLAPIKQLMQTSYALGHDDELPHTYRWPR